MNNMGFESMVLLDKVKMWIYRHYVGKPLEFLHAAGHLLLFSNRVKSAKPFKYAVIPIISGLMLIHTNNISRRNITFDCL